MLHMWPFTRKRTLMVFRFQTVFCSQTVRKPFEINLHPFERFGSTVPKNLHPFKQLGQLFTKIVNPCEWFATRFAKFLNPFKRFGKPFAKFFNPFKRFGKPFAQFLNPFESLIKLWFCRLNKCAKNISQPAHVGFCFESAAKCRGEKDYFTFVWHSLLFRPVKWSSFKEKYFTEVIFLRRLPKKSYFRKQIFVSQHVLAFVFQKRRKGTAEKKDNFTFVLHSLVIRPVK